MPAAESTRVGKAAPQSLAPSKRWIGCLTDSGTHHPLLDAPTHSSRRLTHPEGWVLYLSRAQPERLVVFVHGFRGGALDTWQLDAQVRLFCPASAGLRPAGLLGMAHATSYWRPIEILLRGSSAYTDLQPGSEFLTDVRRRTETLVGEHRTELGALRARIVWANRDDVVADNRYKDDYVANYVYGKSHFTVCRPDLAYQTPWLFVETGQVE